jgi:ABC-type sugar transport system permease subunit
LFVVYPTLETFRLSFFREVATQQEPVGFAQYMRLLTNEVFLAALLNTAFLGVVFLLLVIPLSLVLASLLNNLCLAPNLFKVIYFLPQITSTVAVAIIFSYVFQPSWGLVNGALRMLGVDPLPLWLAEPRYVLTGSRSAATILAVWVALGYYMLIFLAGLQAIPMDLYDAAVVDGAGPLQSWWYITVPSLRPSFVFLIMTGTIDAMSRFSDLWTLGGPAGTPARSLQTIVMFMYQTAFEGNDFNLASAVAVILFVIVLALTLVNFRALLQREFSAR